MKDQEPGTARRRRVPTREELASWRLFIEVTEEIKAHMGSRLQRESGISSGDYTVLLALSEAPGTRLRSSELAVAINWERSRLSHHLGRMERRGLVLREECATDSRGAEVVLSPQGATVFRESSVLHLMAIQQLFVEPLTPAMIKEAENIAAALRAGLRSTAGTEEKR
ncbi:MarR family winged helix-turn-helix transcriptional regulator [Streptomyces sp. NPDC058653]|uniref:MarR family winged helix-turn-helix transcriptional regulator n=1 Tax=Streptomyces sp. NPDC058653 TaxID=3346576 RepID=UPI0036573B17